MRIRIDLAYDGRDFHGWAAQPGLRTVQGRLEEALATVLRRPGIATTCAGRTDTGVHARGQVAHADVDEADLATAAGRGGAGLDADGGARLLAGRLDRLLPDDLTVRRVTVAPPGFDARFSALWRRYAYRVGDGPADPLVRGHVLSWRRPLDVEAMNRAAGPLLGEHDFAAFCKAREGATTVRELLELRWDRGDGDRWRLATATVRADAFCHHMVRSLVGALLAVGEGRRPPDWVAEVLAARRRDPGVPVVPAHGLTLEEVGYPDDAELAARAAATRAVRGPARG